MFATLLVGTALAGPPQLGLALGPVMGGGESTLGSYFSAAPATAVTVTWHLGPFETWVGASGSLLLAGSGDEVVPASLIQGEVGAGFGGRALGVGLYGGNGFPGPLAGLYARGTVPGKGWVRRMGLETRLFYTQATDSTALALLVRIEPGRPHSDPRREPEVVAAPEPTEPTTTAGAAAGEPVPAEAAEVPVETAPEEAPAEETTPPEPADQRPTHHDEPF